LKQEGFSIELQINGGCKFSSAEFLENMLGKLPGPLLNQKTICPFNAFKNGVTVTGEHP
jgi:hypothetical protein